MAIQKGAAGSATYTLELDGAPKGFLQSFYGGMATADVVVETAGADRIQKKHLGNVYLEEIVITFSETMDKAVYDWIASTLTGNIVRKNGAVIVGDLTNTPVYRLDFSNALITEIGFPALDASSKDPATLSLKFLPESASLNRNPQAGTASSAGYKNSRWLVSNFRLAIDGVDCTSVATIDGFTVKQTVPQNSVGQIRSASQAPINLEFPNLVVTLADAKAGTFYDWHDSFVVRGNDADAQEKNGSLQYLAPDLKSTLFTVNFNHLGIFRLDRVSATSGSQAIQRVVAEMYCEQITFGPASVATTTATQSTTQNPQGIAVSTVSTPVLSGQALSLPVQPCNPTAQPAINVRSLQANRVAPSLRFRA